jgi:Rps23 Pro-64 3,4-dihydroxylase Tpa1-like proline 4-hydroxylase
MKNNMCIQKFDNFFDEELFEEVIFFIKTIMNSKQSKLTTNRTWGEGLISHSSPIIRYQFDNNDTDLFNKIKEVVSKKTEYYITEGVFHIFPKLAYIPWHNDTHCEQALTIYLNEDWDENWGGIFLYKKDNEIMGIVPHKNLGILLEAGTGHCVTTTNINAEDRISLQFFLTKKRRLF